MSEPIQLPVGRRVLRDELRMLERKALQREGKNRTDAIEKANAQLEPLGLPKLKTSTVSDWIEKGNPAKNFLVLWALVRVFLEWSGGLPPKGATTPKDPVGAKAKAAWNYTEEGWRLRWEDAKRSRPPTPAPENARLLTAYLRAARDAAGQHPYRSTRQDLKLPALADVYVRQHTRTRAQGNEASAAVPAAQVFRADHSICLLLGAPGGGKSTLLRTHLAQTAEALLSNTAEKTIPILLRAAALTTTDPLPAALARTVTADLQQDGLLDELPTGFFRRPPRTGASWLVLVDGLDEIPDTDTRSAVMTKLANVSANSEGLYRFVVATRPLPAQELLKLGDRVAHYELQPFSHDDLYTYATHWFRSLDNPRRHTEAFIAGLTHSGLEVLARTPLMALMLCQLYLTDPTRPLPAGRAGAYQEFVKWIYEQNTHKNIKNTHDQAIRRLKDRHQIPEESDAAESAAEQVRQHLRGLIDHLAYERLNGRRGAAVDILASHLQVNRPREVEQHLWNAFLGDLMRPTGILTQHGDDFDFLHQTLLEYRAARHATRNEQTCTQLLNDLIASSTVRSDGRLAPPAVADSYLGFLLDGLSAFHGRIAAETTRYVVEIMQHGGEGTHRFLTTQVYLKTNLPPGPTAVCLARLADNPALDGLARVTAARALAEVDSNAGAHHLARLANDPTLNDGSHLEAARALAEVDSKAGAHHLARLANDPTLNDDFRVRAARALAEVDSKAGAHHLARLANDPTLNDSFRVEAARALAEVDSKAGAHHLARLADDPTLNDSFRVEAARALAEVDSKAGAHHLARLANDPTLDDFSSGRAARVLAQTEARGRGR
ncbi:NACHT domain-containing protein [Streptomyces sp. RLB3-17]|uniref:NACHT domain-containing protein n=1 Tax=unclassified Streptomyces TaxID=2593676 RepID=UPI001162B3FC|nr:MULTISPECIES: NACHT domain-containing protein [unclassified Streptomyces]QDN85501.1 NACHT domain-containing protein [Streptomyces sp. RLB3-6]QDO37845.1 NACHT domain-containing protein [Streptomyces sp. RLB3-17]